ncbi:MAG: PAS domain S-box protein [Nitrospirota bacterium]
MTTKISKTRQRSKERERTGIKENNSTGRKVKVESLAETKPRQKISRTRPDRENSKARIGAETKVKSAAIRKTHPLKIARLRAMNEMRLRKAAEKLLRSGKAPAKKRLEDDGLSEKSLARFVHELQVHQVELEMQNEELRRAQDDLIASQKKYTDLYDFAPVGYLTLTRQGLISEANLTASAMLGTARRRLIKMPFIMYSVDKKMFFNHLKKVFETGKRQTCQLVIKKKDGSFFHAGLESIVSNEEEGKNTTCRTVMSDISEHKQAEGAIETERTKAISEKIRLEAVMEALPVGVAIVDLQGGNIRANKAFERIWGSPRPAARSIGDYAQYKAWWVDSGKPVEPEEWASARAVQRGDKVVGQVMKIEKFDGTLAIVHNSAVPILDPDGNITGSAVAIMDITKLVDIESLLKKEWDFNKAVLETVGSLIVVLDRQGRIVNFNKACQDVTGYTFEEVKNRIFWDLLLLPEEVVPVQTVFASLFAGQFPNRFENYWLTKDGRRRLIDWTNTALLNQKGEVEYLIGTGLDITDQRGFEETLRRSEEDLNRAQAVSRTGSWRLNVQKNELLWSDENWDIFGVPKGTPLTYEAFLLMVHPEDRDYVDRKWTAALRGKPYDIEHRIIVGDAIKWVRERAELEFDREGNLLGGFGTTQDITEKKLAEEEIRKLAKFPSENPNPVFRLDRDGALLFANQAGQSFLTHWGTASGDRALDLLRNLAAEALADLSVKVVEIPGDDKTWSFSVAPIPEFGYVNFYGTNITERKQAEEALRKSEHALRIARDELEIKVQERTAEIRDKADLIDSLFTYTITPLALLDREFNFIRVNQAYADVCAKDINEIPGHNHFKFYPHEENELIFRRVVETKVPYQVLAKPFVFPDHPEWGVTYWDWTLTPLLNNTGGVKFLIFSLNDVTGRIKAQEKIKIERNRLKTILDTTPDGVLIVGRDYTIQYINPALEKYFGPVREQKCHQYFHGVDNACSWCRNPEVFAGNTVHEEWTYTATGRTYELLSTPFTHDDGSVSKMQIFRDITERKERESRIEVTDTLLSLFVQTCSKQEYLQSVIKVIHEWTGCRCVGIRVADNRGFIPYEAYLGFSQEFWKLENMLSLNKDMCACIRTVTGQFEPQDASVLTPNGSVCINNSQAFLNGLSEDEKTRFRGNCIRSGFLSIALITVCYRGQTIGLIHLADERERKTPIGVVQFIESISSLIGEALHRFDTEEALRRSEASLNEAQGIAHIGNWEWNIETNELFWSNEIYRIFGTSRNQFGATYEAVLDFIHPDDRDTVHDAVTNSFFEKKPYSVIHRIILSTGEEKTVQERGEIIFGENNVPLRMVGTIQDITEQKKIEEQLRASQEQLRNLYAHLQKMREQEREKIAREIHDEFGTMLTALKIDVAWLEKKLSGEHPDFVNRLHKDLELLSSAIKTVQRISSELRPGILDHLGLASAIEWQVKEFGERMGIEWNIDINAERTEIDRDISISVFRILQEALTNIARHAAASAIQITLKEKTHSLHMEITDNGRGITDEEIAHPQSFGLIGIRERVKQLGGDVEIGRVPQGGTRLTIRILLGQGVRK